MVDLTDLSPRDWRTIIDNSKAAIDSLIDNIEQVVEEENPPRINDIILRKALGRIDSGNILKASRNGEHPTGITVNMSNHSLFSDPRDGETFTDDEIVARLVSATDNATASALIVCGEAGFLKRYRSLVDSVLQMAKRKNVHVQIYYQNLPKNLKSELIESGCEMIQGDEYPRNHFWIIDDKFAYYHTHPRRQDEFISDPCQIAMLKAKFEELTICPARSNAGLDQAKGK